ncbi:MAG TPA: nitronate monooxygenase [Acidobacteriota bacterium]|nr:nitronate monooxygenase [Acidobacteriota bacterium]
MSKWTETALTKRLGIPYPIIQGPMGGGFSTPLLVSSVSNAGGLGSLGVFHLSPEDILRAADEIRQSTSRPFGLNLWVSNHDEAAKDYPLHRLEEGMDWMEPYYRELGLQRPAQPPSLTYQDFEAQAAAVIEARPAVFSFVFGIPSESILERCRRQGILTVGAATTLDEAEALQEAGVDMIVASGLEAGGHRPSFMAEAEDSLVGTLPLLRQIVSKVGLPVIAAGGIADGAGAAAALTGGAAAVQLGTAFLACEESGAPPLHRRMLFSPEARHTLLTRVFSGRLARSIRNRLYEEWTETSAPIAPYPLQGRLAGTLRQAAIEQGRSDLISLWSGQAAPLLRHRQAAELMGSLVAEVESALAGKRSSQ